MPEQIKDLLERAVGWFEPTETDLVRVAGRAARRLRRHRIGAGIIAFAVFAGAGAFLVSSFRHGEPAPATQTLPPAPPATLRTTSLSVPSVFGVATTSEDVWLASGGHVLRIDQMQDKLIASIPIDGLDDQDSISASSAVWVTVASLHEVVEIDPSSNSISATVPVPGYPVQIAADQSGVWVISATGGQALLMRIDLTSRAVALRIPLSGTPTLGLAVGEGSVWVDDGGDLLRVTPDGTRTRLPGAGGSPIAIGAGSVWEGESSGVLRLDAASGDVLARIPTVAPIGLAFADGSLWVLTDTGSTSETFYLPDPKHPSTVLRIDPATDLVDAGPVGVGTKPAWIAAATGTAWVANFNETRLLKIQLEAANASSSPFPGVQG